MSRRGENIYRRKDGRWEGRYQIGKRMDGKTKYRSIYGKTYHEVRIKLYPLKTEYAAKILTKGKCADPFYKWAFYWLDSIREDLKPSTYASYRYKMERFILPYIGDIALNQLERGQVEELIDYWKRENHASSTIHLHFQLLKRCLECAIKRTVLRTNLCEGIVLPKKKKRKVHTLNKQEQKRLEQAARLAPLNKGLPILMSLQTGLRIGEIAALKWEDVDLENKLISVKETYQRIPLFTTGKKKTQLIYQEAKTDASKRRVPLTKELLTKLREKKKSDKQEFVFTAGTRPCEPRLLTYHFHQVMRKAGLFKVHFHQLRHTFATRCMEKNHDVASISALLGHASTQMTLDIYADSLMEQRIAIIRSLER